MFGCVYSLCMLLEVMRKILNEMLQCICIYNIELVGFSLLFSSVCFGHTLGAVA